MQIAGVIYAATARYSHSRSQRGYMLCQHCGERLGDDVVQLRHGPVVEDMRRNLVYVDYAESVLACRDCFVGMVYAAGTGIAAELLVRDEGWDEEEAYDFISYNNAIDMDEQCDTLLSDCETYEPDVCDLCDDTITIGEAITVITRGEVIGYNFIPTPPLLHHSPDRHVCCRCSEFFTH